MTFGRNKFSENRKTGSAGTILLLPLTYIVSSISRHSQHCKKKYESVGVCMYAYTLHKCPL